MSELDLPATAALTEALVCCKIDELTVFCETVSLLQLTVTALVVVVVDLLLFVLSVLCEPLEDFLVDSVFAVDDELPDVGLVGDVFASDVVVSSAVLASSSTLSASSVIVVAFGSLCSRFAALLFA